MVPGDSALQVRLHHRGIRGRSTSLSRAFWAKWSRRFLAAVAPVAHRTCLIDRISSSFAGDQASAAAERQVLESPLNENDDAALKLHDVNQVDEEPHQPGKQPGNVDAKNICHRGRAANHGHVSFIEIMKWRPLFLPFQPRTNDSCRVRSALHRDLRDTWKQLSLFIEGVREIANDENIRKIGNG